MTTTRLPVTWIKNPAKGVNDPERIQVVELDPAQILGDLPARLAALEQHRHAMVQGDGRTLPPEQQDAAQALGDALARPPRVNPALLAAFKANPDIMEQQDAKPCARPVCHCGDHMDEHTHANHVPVEMTEPEEAKPDADEVCADDTCEIERLRDQIAALRAKLDEAITDRDQSERDEAEAEDRAADMKTDLAAKDARFAELERERDTALDRQCAALRDLEFVGSERNAAIRERDEAYVKLSNSTIGLIEATKRAEAAEVEARHEKRRADNREYVGKQLARAEAELAKETQAKLVALTAAADAVEREGVAKAQRDRLAWLLREMRNAVKDVPAMNHQKYDALGIAVNKALAAHDAARMGNAKAQPADA